MNEEWKAIPGLTGYECSDCGRVRSIDRTIQGRHGPTLRKGLTLKLTTRKDNGYVQVIIQKKCYRVNRLVALTFIPNPDNLAEVDHKDKDKTSNKKSNLRWISRDDHRDKDHAKVYEFISPEGERMTIRNLNVFCKENGLHQGSMVHVSQGTRPQHKGWTK